MKWMHENDDLSDVILDYGCGHGDDATILLSMGYRTSKYDPYFFPDPIGRKYNVVTCLYVLNTISKSADRREIICNVKSRLRNKGNSYFAIRADKKKLKGKTSKGTWQGYTPKELIVAGGELLHKTSSFELYQIKGK